MRLKRLLISKDVSLWATVWLWLWWFCVSMYIQCASVCVFVDAVRKLQDEIPRIVWEYALPHAVLPQRVSGSSSLSFHLPISSSGTLPRNFGLGKRLRPLSHTQTQIRPLALCQIWVLCTLTQLLNLAWYSHDVSFRIILVAHMPWSRSLSLRLAGRKWEWVACGLVCRCIPEWFCLPSSFSWIKLKWSLANFK